MQGTRAFDNREPCIPFTRNAPSTRTEIYETLLRLIVVRPHETVHVNDDVNQRILNELRLIRRTSNFALVVCAVVAIGAVIFLPLRSRPLSPRPPAQTPTDSWEAVRTAIDQIDYDKASVIAERILRRYPNDYYGYSYLGSIALAADRLEEAERHFARAYELLPSEENEKMLRAVRKRIETEKPVATQ